MRLPAAVRKALVDLFSDGSEEVKRAERLMAPIAADDLEGGYQALSAIRQNMSEIVGWKTLHNQEVPQSALNEADMDQLRQYLANNGVDMSDAARNARAAEQGYGEEIFGRGVGTPSSQYYGFNRSLDHFDEPRDIRGPTATVFAAPLDEPWQYQSYTGVEGITPFQGHRAAVRPDFDDPNWVGTEMPTLGSLVAAPYNVGVRTRNMPRQVIDAQGAPYWEAAEQVAPGRPFTMTNVRDQGGQYQQLPDSAYDSMGELLDAPRGGDPMDGPIGTQYNFASRDVRDQNAMFLPQYVGRRGLLLGLGGAAVAPYALGTPYGTQE